MKTTSATPPGRRSELTIGLAVVVGRSPEERPPPPTGPTPPSPPQPDLRSNEGWTQRINCVDPNEVRTGKTVEPVGVASSTESHKDDLYTDPSEFWDPEDLDHSRESDGPLLRAVLR